MIWDRIASVAAFQAAYESFILALEGAVAVGVDGLKARNPRLATFQGLAAVERVRSAHANLVFHARMAVAEGASAGSTDGEGKTDPALQAERAAMIESIVLNAAAIDENRARMIIRNQALTYDIAYRTMKHHLALAKAIGELGDDAFSQLDRANRRFKSVDLVVGYVRLAAATTYLETFIGAASARGETQALLIRDGVEPELVELADVDLLKVSFFHPNSVYELRVAP